MRAGFSIFCTLALLSAAFLLSPTGHRQNASVQTAEFEEVDPPKTSHQSYSEEPVVAGKPIRVILPSPYEMVSR